MAEAKAEEKVKAEEKPVKEKAVTAEEKAEKKPAVKTQAKKESAEKKEAKPVKEAKPEKKEEKAEAKEEKKEAKEEEKKAKPDEEKTDAKPAKPRTKKIVGKKTESLVEPDVYLKTGAHIGTKFKSGEMRRFIYKERKDGLKVLNVQTLDERIKLAANFLSQFPSEDLVVVARKLYAHTPVKAFAEAVGCKYLTARFIPGTFTNPQAKIFVEPAAVVVAETDSDAQAVLEAASAKVPMVAFASTNNSLRNVDLVVPINNKGRRSLALAYWLLARELLKISGKIKSDAEFTKPVEDFEFKLKEGGFRREPKKRFARKGFKGRRHGRR